MTEWSRSYTVFALVYFKIIFLFIIVWLLWQYRRMFIQFQFQFWNQSWKSFTHKNKDLFYTANKKSVQGVWQAYVLNEFLTAHSSRAPQYFEKTFKVL